MLLCCPLCKLIPPGRATSFLAECLHIYEFLVDRPGKQVSIYKAPQVYTAALSCVPTLEMFSLSLSVSWHFSSKSTAPSKHCIRATLKTLCCPCSVIYGTMQRSSQAAPGFAPLFFFREEYVEKEQTETYLSSSPQHLVGYVRQWGLFSIVSVCTQFWCLCFLSYLCDLILCFECIDR